MKISISYEDTIYGVKSKKDFIFDKYEVYHNEDLLKCFIKTANVLGFPTDSLVAKSKSDDTTRKISVSFDKEKYF